MNYYYERRSETIIGDTNLISIWYSPDYNFIDIKAYENIEDILFIFWRWIVERNHNLFNLGVNFD